MPAPLQVGAAPDSLTVLALILFAGQVPSVAERELDVRQTVGFGRRQRGKQAVFYYGLIEGVQNTLRETGREREHLSGGRAPDLAADAHTYAKWSDGARKSARGLH
jgi:hypothetical protein